MVARWTDRELEYLSNNAGYLTHSEIGKKLGRSRWAIKHKQRRLGIRFIDNVYTCTLLSKELGRSRRRIRLWIERGWLKGKQAAWSWCYGKRPWLFREEDVICFLKEHCYLFDPSKVPNRYFANVVRDAVVQAPSQAVLVGSLSSLGKTGSTYLSSGAV